MLLWQLIIVHFRISAWLTSKARDCRDPKLAQANDFFFSGFHIPGNTTTAVGSIVIPVNVVQIPGLNTLGLSMARVDFALWGISSPHFHPSATEIFTVVEGTLQVGFVTSNPENRLISKVLNKGDAFVFPVGLIHYQRNSEYGKASAIASLSSQNAGVVTIANAVFGSTPDISNEVLACAFQIGKNVTKRIKARF